MSMDASEGQPKSVVERINALRQQQIQSGELRETSIGTFHFSYLSDPRYQNVDPTVKAAFEQLNIPDLTITETEKAVRDLKIKKGLTVNTVIPTAEERVNVIPSLGIGGRAISPTEVRYFFDLTHPKVVESLRLWKKKQVAHETNHLARWQSGQFGNTLLDALISEGLATRYEEHWGGEYLATPWGQALTETELTIEWKRAQGELHSQQYSHPEWFFGRNERHPWWTGYSLGTAIVNEYVSKHPNIPMRDLVRMPSVNILKGSSFQKPARKFFGLFSRD